MLEKGGASIGGLYDQPEEVRQMGVPPHWMVYIDVTDLDASSEKAKTLGGNLLKGPFDVGEFGRMSVIQDPAGAVFAMWQSKGYSAPQLVNEPGSVSWNELMTKDDRVALPFYQGLFGWEPKTKEVHGTPYHVMNLGAQKVGGIMQMTAEFGDMPSHWMVYFQVEDCDAAAAQVTSLGGTVCVPPTAIEDEDIKMKFSVVQDPQGAAFSIIQIDMMA